VDAKQKSVLLHLKNSKSSDFYQLNYS